MIWLVRIAVVGGSALLAYQQYPDLTGILSGLFWGLVLLGLSDIIAGTICQIISAKAPSASANVGVTLYWIGFVFAILTLISAVWNYAFVSGRRAVAALFFAFLWWSAGWGLRRSLDRSLK